MGQKGAKESSAAAGAAGALVDELQPLGAVRSKRMFGGYGIFAGDVMFALVDPEGRPFLRVDDRTRPRFEQDGAQAHGRMPYWSIPPSVRGDDDLLLTWAREALDVARSAR